MLTIYVTNETRKGLGKCCTIVKVWCDGLTSVTSTC